MKMGKSDPLKDKPKAPTRKEIVADLARASKTDVVFQSSLRDCEDAHAPEPSSSNTSNSSHTSKASTEELDDTYNNVTKLIDLQEQLLQEPAILNEKYELLRQLGEEVSQSISEIKSAAEK